MISKLQLFLLTGLLCASSGIAAQTTRLLLISEEGDYIGQGQTYDLDESDGAFSASVNFDDGVTINFDGESLDFNLDFAHPEYRQYSEFLEGPYPGARRFPFNSPTGPGLSVSGNGRGCNNLYGEFDVLEVEIAAGSVVSFAADFVQHCEGPDEPALHGEIRYQASGQPYPSAPDRDGDAIPDTLDNCLEEPNPGQGDVDLDAFGNSCDQQWTNTNIHMESQEGDSIGRGKTYDFYLKDGYITGTQNHSNGVSIAFDGRDSWSLRFSAPGDAVLTPGEYKGATRYPFNEPDEPGLSVSGAGRGCSDVSGEFTVHAVEFGPDDEVLKFDASFIQYCGSSSAALTGRVILNGDKPDLIFHGDFEQEPLNRVKR